ncbi:MAG: hypothetical protein J1F22_01555 [Lachnospiraceae bacterium]|nr:hypothetical protein [Lachnospiraceae bacterium]
MKKIIAMGLTVILCLTGCGTPDAVVEEIEKLEPGVISTKADVDSAWEKLAWKEELKAVSSVKQQQMRKFAETIDKLLKENKQIEEAYEGGPAILKSWIDFQMGRDDFDSTFSLDSQCSYSIKTTKDLETFLTVLEKNGYGNMKGYSVKQYTGVRFVRQGVMFQLDSGDNWDRDGMELIMRIPAARIGYPQRYTEFIERNIGDGFLLENIQCGYMDVFQLIGSINEPGNPYDKQITLYFNKDEGEQEKKPLQMEIRIEENTKKAGGLVFSAYEQQTVINVLTAMTNNKAEAESFVRNFRIVEETEGSIGDRNWYLLDNTGTDTNGSYCLRIQ